MARGRKTSLTIRLAADERHTLMAWQRSTTIPAGRARRGRIILLVADGVPISHIADTVGISRRFVYKWAKRFLQYGVDGLADKPGRGHRHSPDRYPNCASPRHESTNLRHDGRHLRKLLLPDSTRAGLPDGLWPGSLPLR